MNLGPMVRFVDDFRHSCPGTVNGNTLVHIANQIQRRRWRKNKIKHMIFQEKGTRNLWYKNSNCNAGVVAMGFSLKRLDMHPKAKTSLYYADKFLGPEQPDNKWTERMNWLKRNDFELIK